MISKKQKPCSTTSRSRARPTSTRRRKTLYVFIPLGGGTTGVQQTVDLKLNQHVRRVYKAEEAVELIDQMRAGVSIPRCNPEKCVDILAQVMSPQALHLQAADAYLEAGWTVPLDDDGSDVFIVK